MLRPSHIGAHAAHATTTASSRTGAPAARSSRSCALCQHPSKLAPRHRLTRRSAQESRELTMRGATKVQAVAAAPPVAAYPTAQPAAQPAPVSTMGKGP